MVIQQVVRVDVQEVLAQVVPVQVAQLARAVALEHPAVVQAVVHQVDLPVGDLAAHLQVVAVLIVHVVMVMVAMIAAVVVVTVS